MAKIKTTAYLETIKTTVDGKNWVEGDYYPFEINPEEQEGGLVATVTIPQESAGKTYTLNEMRELFRAMETTDRGLGD